MTFRYRLLLALAAAIDAPARGIQDDKIEPWRLDVRQAVADLRAELAVEQEPNRG